MTRRRINGRFPLSATCRERGPSTHTLSCEAERVFAAFLACHEAAEGKALALSLTNLILQLARRGDEVPVWLARAFQQHCARMGWIDQEANSNEN